MIAAESARLRLGKPAAGMAESFQRGLGQSYAEMSSARQLHQSGIILLMPLDFRELVGFIAALLTTVAFVPQALKSWRTRDLSGVSLTMYSLFTVGVALWLAYGVMIDSWPIIIANAITLLLAGVVLALKVKHK